jgi:hypothetical protein
MLAAWVSCRDGNLFPLCRSPGRDSSVGIATQYGLDGPGIEFRWGRDFSYTMGTGYFLGVKRPGRGLDHSTPSRAEVKERVEL